MGVGFFPDLNLPAKTRFSVSCLIPWSWLLLQWLKCIIYNLCWGLALGSSILLSALFPDIQISLMLCSVYFTAICYGCFEMSGRLRARNWVTSSGTHCLASRKAGRVWRTVTLWRCQLNCSRKYWNHQEIYRDWVCSSDWPWTPRVVGDDLISYCPTSTSWVFNTGMHRHIQFYVALGMNQSSVHATQLP